MNKFDLASGSHTLEFPLKEKIPSKRAMLRAAREIHRQMKPYVISLKADQDGAVRRFTAMAHELHIVEYREQPIHKTGYDKGTGIIIPGGGELMHWRVSYSVRNEWGLLVTPWYTIELDTINRARHQKHFRRKS